MNSDSKVFKILFVCMGNICRSPAAENIMNEMIQKEGLGEVVKCDSAGTLNYHVGQSPDGRMRKAGIKRGYNFTGSARHIQPIDLLHFDLIIGMDSDNISYIESLDKEKIYNDNIKCFVEYCDKFEIDGVPDPYYGGGEGFNHVIDIVENGCANLLKEVKAKIN